ncbi:MAG: nuclear transport factor 2 family protein [Anaerolineae bacterium]|nr:nuclear transport factor 2 family protein [Anaerolineae bacterium]
MGSPLAIVQSWQAAASKPDIDRLIELSDPNIEIVGPRGSGFGHQLLRDWVARAGLKMTTLQAFVHDSLVVVEQQAFWHNVETGEKVSESIIASQFVVENERVKQFARYDNLETAFKQSGLNLADEVKLGT